MTDKWIDDLNPTANAADDSNFIIARNGQTEIERITGLDLKSYFFGSVAITGGTIDGTVIGGATPATAAFTTLASNSIDTGQGPVECYAMDQGVETTDSVTFNGLSLTVALGVSDGGTGSSTASGARTNLGVVIGSDVQAYDGGLQSISGLTTAADTGIYTTGSDVYSTYTLTAGGRSIGGVAGTINTFPYFSATNVASLASITSAGLDILDDATASDQRTTLGLAIGSDVQAYDAGLQSISGLTTAADNMIYTTGPDTYAVTSLTSFARTILDDANAADMRTTLGLGTISTQSSSNVTITGGSITGITDLAIADGGTGASDASGARANLGLGTIAIQNSNNVTITGGSITGIADLAITDGGTGASDAPTAFDNLKQSATTSATGVVFLTDNVTASLGTDADHDVDIASGIFNFDDGSGQVAISALTKQIDAAWVAGTNSGGLFSGTVAANTTYHLFLIYNPMSGIADAGWDTSITAANIPAGYTKKRRLLSQRTDASSNLLNGDYFFDSIGNYEFILKIPIQDQDLQINTTAQNLSVTVPDDLSVKYYGNVGNNGGGGSTAYYYSPLSDDPTINDDYDISIGDSMNSAERNRIEIRTNTSSEIRAVASGNLNSAVYARGWYDDNF